MRNARCEIFAGILAACLLIFAPIYTANAAGIAKTKTYVTDSALTAEIKGKFLFEKGLDSFDIKVKTANGVVTLRGQVEKGFQSRLAEKIARETKGVRDVKNRISVLHEDAASI